MPETGLDFPREWIEFPDPDEENGVIRADLTWLLSSWTCVFGQGCPGIEPDQPDDGCCVHGAFYTDRDDEKRVRKAAARLTPETWQHHRRRFADTVAADTLPDDDGVERPARKTAVVDGACVFHNRPGFEGGTGCALHAQALRDGVHPLEYKPEVCWQLPIKRDFSTVDRNDETSLHVTWIGEFDRRGWGPGGHDFAWWCTSSPLAHRGAEPVYRSNRAELVALLGEEGYARLAELCDARYAAGQIAPHPATTRARQLKLTPVRHPVESANGLVVR
ncbi:hypothetical protein GCM10023223_39120 [Stackebrandtia albiflava]